MSEVIEQELIPVVEPVPEEVPELTYTYQPTDEEGRNMGGKQVIKYRTTDELTAKLTEQSTLLIRRLRKETRNNRLGISQNDEIPAEAQRFSGPVEFNPRELTEEESYQLSKDLMDPTKAIAAQERLFEARIGVSSETLRHVLRSNQESNMQIQARQQSDAFVADNPGYFKCQENFEAITGWMTRYDLAPVKENFQKAYDTLIAQEVIVLGPGQPTPIPERILEPVVPVVEPVAPVEPERIQYAPARIPSGLNRENSASTGITPAPGSDIVYKVVVNDQERVFVGLQALNAMPGEEYRRRMNDPAFVRSVKKLDADIAAAKRRPVE